MFSTATFITSIASIDFNLLSITYLMKLPSMDQWVFLGKFVSADKFYIALYTSTVIWNISTPTTITITGQGEIYSSDQNESCYTMQTGSSTSGTMTASSALTD